MAAMPDPGRLVRRSAAVCRANGLPDAKSYLLISGIADAMIVELLAAGETDVGWLREISALAQRYYAGVTSPDRRPGR